MNIDLNLEPAFVITKASVTFAFPNGQTMTLLSTHELYNDICNSLLHKEWKYTSKLVNRALTIKEQTEGEFIIKDGELYWQDNIKVPVSLAKRILDSAIKEQPKRMYTLFSLRLKENPSTSARDSLFTFLEHKLPLTDRGTFLAYKTVKSDYRDKHTGKIDNRVGSIVEMLRAHVDANRSVECSTGLHVGSFSYVTGFGSSSSDKLLVVEVDPMDVVAVPNHDASKMRVCRYRVLGEINWSTQLPKDFISIAEVSNLFINVDDKKSKKRHQPLVVEGTNENAVGSLFFSDLISYLTRAQARGVTEATVKTIQSRFKGVSSKSIAEMLIDLCNAKDNKKYISIVDKKASPTNIVVKLKASSKFTLVEPQPSEMDIDLVVSSSRSEDIEPEVPSRKEKSSKSSALDAVELDVQTYLLRRKDTGFTETTVKQVQSAVGKRLPLTSERIEDIFDKLVSNNPSWSVDKQQAKQKTSITTA